MKGYRGRVKRCQHIKTDGGQCGSPALKGERFCFYHGENRAERVKVKGADGKGMEILVPVFEDASSIQTMLRRVAILLLEDKIDGKKAGQLLYTLQIASTNLKQMKEERPRAEQVVVDKRKVAETPVGMTPWSLEEGGHEPEKLPDEKIARTKREILREQEQERRDRENERKTWRIEEVKRWMEEYRRHIDRWLTEPPTVENLTWRMGSMRDCFAASAVKMATGERLMDFML